MRVLILIQMCFNVLAELSKIYFIKPLENAATVINATPLSSAFGEIVLGHRPGGCV